MAKTKVDLHVHVDNRANKDYLISKLKEAEANGVKAISFLEHNLMKAYEKDGPLAQIIQEDGIDKYYSGKLIAGCEFDCLLENVPMGESGYDYNNNIVHILGLGFDPVKLLNTDLYNPDLVYERWFNDVKTLCEIGKALGLPMPEYENFDYNGKHYVKQFYYYLMGKPGLKEKFIETMDIPEEFMDNESVFFRKLFNDAQGKMHYRCESIPTLEEVVRVVHECGGQIFIAHPDHMNRAFPSGLEYVEMLRAIPDYEEGIKNIDGIEAGYLYNNYDDTLKFENYARGNGLLYSAGSDNNPNKDGNMFRFVNEERLLFQAHLGESIETYYQTGNGDLTVDKELVKNLADAEKDLINGYNLKQRQTNFEPQF